MPLTSRAWPEADALLRDARWRGSDDAYSVRLDGERTLWLFGDTFVAPPGRPTRTGSAFVRNSVAVQHGLDPLRATMEFAWGGDDAAPDDYFPSGAGGSWWLWPVAGVAGADTVLTFHMEVRTPPPEIAATQGFDMPFEVSGCRAYLARGITGPARAWRWQEVVLPDAAGAVLGTALLRDGDDLYGWAYRRGTALLTRWPAEDALAGELRGMRWWAGPGAWTADAAQARVAVDPAVTEFTVHRTPGGELWLVDVEPLRGDGAAVNVRRADGVEGPWTARDPAYRIPEGARDDAFVYAGKAHPELHADGLVVTYASNGPSLARIYEDESLYYPRFALLHDAAP